MSSPPPPRGGGTGPKSPRNETHTPSGRGSDPAELHEGSSDPHEALCAIPETESTPPGSIAEAPAKW